MFLLVQFVLKKSTQSKLQRVSEKNLEQFVYLLHSTPLPVVTALVRNLVKLSQATSPGKQ